MQIWIAQHTQSRHWAHTRTGTLQVQGTETAHGLGAGSSQTLVSSSHITLGHTAGDMLQTKLVSSPQTRCGNTFWPFPTAPPHPTPPACSQIPSLAASKPVSAAHSGFEQLQTLCPTGSLLLQPGLSQLWLPGFSCSAVTGQHPPPSSSTACMWHHVDF